MILEIEPEIHSRQSQRFQMPPSDHANWIIFKTGEMDSIIGSFETEDTVDVLEGQRSLTFDAPPPIASAKCLGLQLTKLEPLYSWPGLLNA